MVRALSGVSTETSTKLFPRFIWYNLVFSSSRQRLPFARKNLPPPTTSLLSLIWGQGFLSLLYLPADWGWPNRGGQVVCGFLFSLSSFTGTDNSGWMIYIWPFRSHVEGSWILFSLLVGKTCTHGPHCYAMELSVRVPSVGVEVLYAYCLLWSAPCPILPQPLLIHLGSVCAQMF